jgi:hypothetical protein
MSVVRGVVLTSAKTAWIYFVGLAKSQPSGVSGLHQ